jgi:hypothetical protein
MVRRIGARSVEYPLSFVVAGDSGAWPDPTADAIFSQLLRQAAALDPAPLFFANLGDFAGPGSPERHTHYLGLVAGLPLPDLCVVGNHDLDDPSGRQTWAQVHGPTNFAFGWGHTRFIALDAAPAETTQGTTGPDEATLEFLARSLEEPASRTGSCSCILRHSSATVMLRIRSGGSASATGRSWTWSGGIGSGWCAPPTRCCSITTCIMAPTLWCLGAGAARSARICVASALAGRGPRVAVGCSIPSRSPSPPRVGVRPRPAGLRSYPGRSQLRRWHDRSPRG